MRQLTEQDLKDLLAGACILGAGGGGPFSIGESVLKDLAALPPVVLADPSEVQETDRMAVSAFVGSPAQAETAPLDFSAATLAYDLLATTLGVTFTHVLPGEVGAGNSLIPLTVGARKGLPVVDAAGGRRACPGLLMDTYAGNRVPVSPMAIASQSQQVVVSKMDNSVADPVARGVIGGAFNQSAGVAMWSMDGKTMKAAAVGGTTTYALALGATLRRAVGCGRDPVAAVVDFLGGVVLLQGTIASVSEVSRGAFDFGKVTLRSADGTEATIFSQNENLIAWGNRRSQPLAMAPDLICFLTSEGQVFSNADFSMLPKNAEVAVIGQPSIPQMRTPFIIDQFMKAVAATGYGGPYVEIEKLNPWPGGNGQVTSDV
jgi:hypothetical protein